MKKNVKEIKIAGITKEKDEVNITNTYKNWRDYRHSTKEGFAIVPNVFEKYLPFFETKALGLYIFYCLKANNDTGESYYGTETIASKLNKSTRTINQWNTYLEDFGLIKRMNNNMSAKSTFILPISDHYTYLENANLKSMAEPESGTEEKLKSICHLFQWRRGKKDSGNPDNYSDPFNALLFCFERTPISEKLDENFIVRRFVLVESDDLDIKLEAKSNEFKSEIYLINNKSKDIKEIMKEIEKKHEFIIPSYTSLFSFAIPAMYNLAKNGEVDTLKLFKHLSELKDEDMEKVKTIE